MTQAPATDTMTLQIVSCETCDMLFLVSPRRETCPTCGGPPGVVFFTFDATPDGVQLRGGLAVEAAAGDDPGLISREEAAFHLRGLGYTEAEIDKKLGPAPVAEDLPPVDQDGPVEELGPDDYKASATLLTFRYLRGEDVEPDAIREDLLAMGAGPGQAAMAVNDLTAIRDLLDELTAGRERPGAAGPEDLPPSTPDPEAYEAQEPVADAPAGEPNDVPEAQTFTESPSQPS